MQISNLQADHIRGCLEHMKAHGFSFDGHLEVDGKLHRFSKDSKKNQLDEWYICHEGVSQKGNSYLICTYGTWSGDQEKYTYRSYDTDRLLSHEEFHQLREQEKERNKQIEARLKEDQKGRIMKAQEMWDLAIKDPAISSQILYLNRKQVDSYGIKYRVEYEGCGVVVIPLRNIEGELQAVQCIQEDGTKRIYGVKKGNFHVIGDIEDNGTVYVAEGYATAASVYMATKHPAVIAFDCGNLKPVIHNLRIKYPNVKFLA